MGTDGDGVRRQRSLDRHRSSRPNSAGTSTEINAWSDPVETWRHGIEAKADAGVDITERLDGERIVDAPPAAARKTKPAIADDVETLERFRQALADGDPATLHEVFTDGAWARLSHRYVDRKPTAVSAKFDVDVDPERGRFSSWYEFFPRSPWDGDAGPGDHATLRDASTASNGSRRWASTCCTSRRSIRSARSTARDATTRPRQRPTTSAARGHPRPLRRPSRLGTIDDVEALATAACERGIELALDIAFQCTPDHVWVEEHPEWFKHRADGSIQFAENPPKKYQDIYPIDFETDDWEAPVGRARRRHPVLDFTGASRSSGSTTRTRRRSRPGSGRAWPRSAPTTRKPFSWRRRSRACG
ncbi:MAG: maltotransferase domain-containing protein [Ilumatobacteraceae bacterium]